MHVELLRFVSWDCLSPWSSDFAWPIAAIWRPSSSTKSFWSPVVLTELITFNWHDYQSTPQSSIITPYVDAWFQFLLGSGSVWWCLFWSLPASVPNSGSGGLRRVWDTRFLGAYFLGVFNMEIGERPMQGDSRPTERSQCCRNYGERRGRVDSGSPIYERGPPPK